MGGFFGVAESERCVNDLFYGVDYNSHMGTKRAGMATCHDGIFNRSIHNIENSYFRTKFESDLDEFSGNCGIGVISDTDAQPIIVNCHLGKFAIVTVARINNIKQLEKELLAKGHHFCEHSYDIINPTEMIAALISEGTDSDFLLEIQTEREEEYTGKPDRGESRRWLQDTAETYHVEEKDCHACGGGTSGVVILPCIIA